MGNPTSLMYLNGNVITRIDTTLDFTKHYLVLGRVDLAKATYCDTYTKENIFVGSIYLIDIQ
jgi:hypothetical protein